MKPDLVVVVAVAMVVVEEGIHMVGKDNTFYRFISIKNTLI